MKIQVWERKFWKEGYLKLQTKDLKVWSLNISFVIYERYVIFLMQS